MYAVRLLLKLFQDVVDALICNLIHSSYLNQKIKEENPFKKAPLQRLYRDIESYAKKKNYSLEAVTKNMKDRNKQVVAKTFHGAGIVVNVENDVGYREIPETNGK